jgi:hypothetical protein
MIATARSLEVDIRLTSRAEHERLVATYRPRGIAVLGERVETQGEFEWAASLSSSSASSYWDGGLAAADTGAFRRSITTKGVCEVIIGRSEETLHLSDNGRDWGGCARAREHHVRLRAEH